MLESRWFDCGTGYCVLVMDPATSGMTWADVQAKLTAGEALPVTVYSAMWGYEEPRGDETAKAAHIDMCKVETVRLAELAFAPQTPATVTLSS